MAIGNFTPLPGETPIYFDPFYELHVFDGLLVELRSAIAKAERKIRPSVVTGSGG